MGSMAPDFESFVRFGRDKIHSHKWFGVFWFDWPLALLIAFVFHLVVRDALIVNLPKSIRARFEFARQFDWLTYFSKHYIVVLTSLLIGIASHLLWDGFTHLNPRYPDAMWSKRMLGPFRVYILLQYICSLIGLIAVIAYCKKMPKAVVKNARQDIIKYWIYILLVAVAIASYVFTFRVYGYRISSLYIINVTIASFLSALVIVSFFEKMMVRKQSSY